MLPLSWRLIVHQAIPIRRLQRWWTVLWHSSEKCVAFLSPDGTLTLVNLFQAYRLVKHYHGIGTQSASIYEEEVMRPL